MMVAYVDSQANIYRLIRILKKIHTYTDTNFRVRKTQKWWNFHRTVQCYRLMLRIPVTLSGNFLHLVTSSQTALVTPVLHYSVMLHVFNHLWDCPRWLEDKVCLFEMQPATNDITGPTRYSSTIAPMYMHS